MNTEWIFGSPGSFIQGDRMLRAPHILWPVWTRVEKLKSAAETYDHLISQCVLPPTPYSYAQVRKKGKATQEIQLGQRNQMSV